MPVTQPTFTCSKSTNGNTRTICVICSNLTIRDTRTTWLTHSFGVSTADFEHVNGILGGTSKQCQFSSL